VTAAILLVATVAWVRAPRHGATLARPLSVVGLLMVVLLFFGGFVCIGGEWFAMYRSTQWNGLEPAFRNSVLALLTLLVVRSAPEIDPASSS
jgi:predicted small integral membrane protein